MSNYSPVLAGSSCVRLLYTQNPFYLIGTLLLLFGVQQCLGREPTLATSGLLVVVLTLYTLVLAGIATVVIRWGQVWDDARTILLVIVLLFFMLSTSLDFQLLFTLDAPWPGTVLLAAGLMFSVLVSECLLRGLRIGLSTAYRAPYYLVLLLLFAYPTALGWMNYYSYYQSVTWFLFAFPAVAALTLLTLLPAARMAPWREAKSGTPWKWPYYPWSLFVYLTIGLAIRSWWLTIAFEPAKGADAYFQPYFLLPFVLVWAVLILEMGLARGLRGAIIAALVLPLAGLVIGFPGPGDNPIEAAFIGRLAESFTSPPQLTIAGMLLFYGYAWLRGVLAAESLFVAIGLLASVISRQTLDWSSLSRPSPLVVAIVGGGLLGLALHRRSTWRALAGVGLMNLGVCFIQPEFDSPTLWFWWWHAPPLAFLAIIVLFDDDLAKVLRNLTWPAAPWLALFGATVYPWTMPSLELPILSAYLALLLVASAFLWLRERRAEVLCATLGTFAANLLAQLRPTYLLLHETVLADGLPWLSAGILIMFSGFAISLLKMGLWPRARQWLNRVNSALGGENHTPQ